MLNLKDCYFHSIICNGDKVLEIVDSIFKDGKIMSLQRSGLKTDNDIRMNKKDEICLSKKGRFSFFCSGAYDMFVLRNLSFVIKGNLPEVYKPKFIPFYQTLITDSKYIDSGLTDLRDEFRTKRDISLDDVTALTIPCRDILESDVCYALFFFRGNIPNLRHYRVSEEVRLQDLKKFYEALSQKMSEHKINIPIYDLNSKTEITSSDDIQKIKKKI